MNKVAQTIFLIIALSSCTKQALYESAQADQRRLCDKHADAQARDDCMRGLDKSYGDYESERRKLKQRP